MGVGRRIVQTAFRFLELEPLPRPGRPVAPATPATAPRIRADLSLVPVMPRSQPPIPSAPRRAAWLSSRLLFQRNAEPAVTSLLASKDRECS